MKQIRGLSVRTVKVAMMLGGAAVVLWAGGAPIIRR
jgi:hypothetical protein